MTKPKSSNRAQPKSAPKTPISSDRPVTPTDHYRHEKHKRASKEEPEDELMAAARREYKALLEAQAAKGKGGRPKKKAAAPKDADADAEELSDDE